MPREKTTTYVESERRKYQARKIKRAFPRVFFREPVPITERTYGSMHAKLADWRSSASHYLCANCRAVGKAVQAKEWSYNKQGGTNERTGSFIRQGRTTIAKYSLDIWDYDPLCKSCHGKRDYNE